MEKNLNLSKQDKKFIGALVFAGVGIICMALTFSVEFAVSRIQRTLDHNAQIQSQINKVRLDIKDHFNRNQGFKPLNELIKGDNKNRKINNKKQEVL